MKKTAAKRALLMSMVSLLLCVTMLVGTTFAWFTDSVTSANNIIKSGNLDVVLEYWDGDSWEDVKGASDILTNLLWEPGVTEVAYLRVANAGSLALKYQLGVNIVEEIKGVNVEGKEFNLSDYIQFGVVDGVNGETNAYATREAAVAALTDAKALNAGYTKASELYPANNTPAGAASELYLALVVYMPTTVGNVANHNGSDIPQIDLGINVYATQLEAEFDSFGNDYDKDSTYPKADIVTVPENNTADVKLVAETFQVTVPASASQAGDVYEMVVSNENIETDVATGATTVAFDLTMYKNDVKVSGDTVYEVKVEIAKGATISAVTHNGVAMTAATTGADQTYTYDSATGVLTIYTKSFSPFAVTYTDYKDFVRKLNRAHTQTSYISVSTGSDFLPVAAVMPEITGYTVFDGDTRIANSVCFRFSKVEKQAIDENSYKVSFNLAIKDENGKDLELKPGMPSTINGKEYLHMYVNLLELPEGYAVSEVKVNGTAFAPTNNAGGNPSTGEYWIGSDGKDVYLQSMEVGLFEITVAKTN